MSAAPAPGRSRAASAISEPPAPARLPAGNPMLEIDPVARRQPRDRRRRPHYLELADLAAVHQLHIIRRLKPASSFTERMMTL